MFCWLGEALALLGMAAFWSPALSAFGMIFALLALMPWTMTFLFWIALRVQGGAVAPTKFVDVVALSQASALLSWFYLMLLIRLMIPVGTMLDHLVIAVRSA